MSQFSSQKQRWRRLLLGNEWQQMRKKKKKHLAQILNGSEYRKKGVKSCSLWGAKILKMCKNWRLFPTYKLTTIFKQWNYYLSTVDKFCKFEAGFDHSMMTLLRKSVRHLAEETRDSLWLTCNVYHSSLKSILHMHFWAYTQDGNDRVKFFRHRKKETVYLLQIMNERQILIFRNIRIRERNVPLTLGTKEFFGANISSPILCVFLSQV